MNLKGVFVPVITPFQKNEGVDLGLLKENILKLNMTRVGGYMPLGSNGEFAMLSDQEALDILRVIKNNTPEDRLLFAGTGRESVYNTAEFTKKAEDIGVDAVFVLTPHYFPKQMSSDSLEAYYSEVAEKASVPVILYSAPGYSAGVEIEPALMKRLAGMPNIIGMKDTSSRPVREYSALLPEHGSFSLLAGTMGKFLVSMLEKAAGGVLSSANYIPQVCCFLFELIVEGEIQKAERLHKKLCALAEETTAPYGVAGVKAAMNIFGYECGAPRRPLKEVTGRELQEMETRLKAGIEEINFMMEE